MIDGGPYTNIDEKYCIFKNVDALQENEANK